MVVNSLGAKRAKKKPRSFLLSILFALIFFLSIFFFFKNEIQIFDAHGWERWKTNNISENVNRLQITCTLAILTFFGKEGCRFDFFYVDTDLDPDLGFGSKFIWTFLTFFHCYKCFLVSCLLFCLSSPSLYKFLYSVSIRRPYQDCNKQKTK